MGLSRQTGHVGSVVEQGVSGEEEVCEWGVPVGLCEGCRWAEVAVRGAVEGDSSGFY